MVQFDRLLARADDVTLQTLIGRESLRLLHAIDENLTLPSRLRRIVLDLHGPAGLLTDTKSRRLLFDLLRRREAERLAILLGVNTGGDLYQSLKKASIYKNSEREELLFNFFNLDPPERKEVKVEPALKKHLPAYALFPHQRTAARGIKRYLDTEPRRVVLHMPTGSGKTRTAMNIIAEHLRKTEPGFVVWLAYSEELCEQAASEFERAWNHLGNRKINIHRFWGSHDLNLDTLGDGFMVAGLAKMYSLAKRRLSHIGKIGQHCTLVIIDEAHQAIAETYGLVLESLLVHHRKPGLLGLTATPGRTWADIEEDEKLADFFARNKVILEIEGYDNPIDYLVDNGYLADAHFESLFVEPGLDLSPEDRRKIKEQLDLPKNVLRQLAEDQERNTAILARLEEMLQRHQRILFFGTTVNHAEVMATVLQSRGYQAAAVTGETESEKRKRYIRKFKKRTDQPMILCNYGVLTTGFDAPETSAALIARPTKSLVLYSQMVGRAIRGPKAGGNEEAEIVTVVDHNLPGFSSVAEAFMNWEDVWE
ncbi:DEAD/DEAH box helicase [Salisaeta longa]|uniref:DEAD/DEAH box helicase n=1 Tax=Salisaeta longa TaxID=503170 RepID=UPI0003B41D30|nr:DEAD/DEAH box helicase [Salisaeta longa]